jgi:hypothetical protein
MNLKQKLGSNWQEEWVANGVLGVQRTQLASIVRQEDDTFKNREIPDERALRLIGEFVDAQQWDGTKNFLLRNPSLLEKGTQQLFDDIVSRLEVEGNRPAFSIFDEYRKLLQRCHAVGIEAAIEEKRTSSDSEQ